MKSPRKACGMEPWKLAMMARAPRCDANALFLCLSIVDLLTREKFGYAVQHRHAHCISGVGSAFESRTQARHDIPHTLIHPQMSA